MFNSANQANDQSYDELLTATPDLSDLTIIDCGLHTHAVHGQRVHFALTDGRYGWAVIVDIYRNSQASAYKLLLSDDETTIWVTGECVNRIGAMTTLDVTPYLSSVMAMPIVAQTYVSGWHGVLVFCEGEIEAVAIDIEGNSVICWVDGIGDFARYPRADVELDELAMEAEYHDWLDELGEVA